MNKKQHLGCICLTCGIRNNFKHPDGMCQNGHDDWLEYREVMGENITTQERAILLYQACNLTGLSKAELKKAFLNPKITHIPVHNDIWNEIEQIMVSNNPFNWHSVEVNDWELGYRMQRISPDAVCPICKKLVKEHPLEKRTSGKPYLHQLCYGVWAKT